MTTPVGSIRLDLIIDGSKVDDAAINEAVRRRLAGVLGETEENVRRVEQAHTDAGKAAEKSADKQVTAAKKVTAAAKPAKQAQDGLAKATKTVAEAQDDLNAAIDIFGRKSPQAEAAAKRLTRAHAVHTDELVRAAARSRASTDSQIQDYQRLARAAEESAAKQVAAQRLSGGGGGGGRSGGGGFGGGGGGVGRFLTSPLGLNSLALGATALPPATLAVTNLAGAVQQLAQGGLLIPGVIGGIVASVGTLKIGLSGVADGFSAAWKAAGDGASAKDIKKATDQMKGLADSAKSTIAAAVGLRPQIDHLTKDIAQQNIFDGLDNTVTTLANKVMPTAEKGLGGISKAWNSTIKTLAGSLGSDSSISLMDRIFGNTAEGQNRLNKAIDPAVHAVETLVAKGTDFLPRLADGMTSGLTRLDNWVTRSEQNGNLDKWINQGIDAAGHFGESLLSVGKIITSITQAAGGDGGLLKLLDTGTKKLADFLGSADGQKKLGDFFTDARQRLGEWIPILGNVANVAGDVFKGFQQWGDAILPAVSGITKALADMPSLVTTAVTAFAGFATLKGLDGLLSKLMGINGLLGGGGVGAGGSRAGGRGAGLGIGGRGLAGGALFLGGLFDQSTEGVNGVNALATIGGGTLIGSELAGPVGAVVGALAGGLTSMIPVIVDSFRKQAETTRQLAEKGTGGVPLWGTPVQGPGLNPAASSPIPLPGSAVPGSYPLTQVPPTIAQNNAGRNLGIVQAQNPSQVGSWMSGPLSKQLQAIGAQVPGIAATGQAADGATQKVSALDQKLAELSGTKVPPIPVTVNTDGALAQISAFAAKAASTSITIPVRINPTSGSATAGGGGGGSWFGHAAGGITQLARGVLPGYSPGFDNLLGRIGNRVFGLSGGEGILIPEAVRGLGGAPGIYAINSMFRPGLSRAGYSGGGVAGFDGGGVVPDTLGGGGFSSALAPVVGLLTQIRDVLGGGAAKSSGTVLGALGDVSTAASDTTATGLTGLAAATGAPSGGILGAVDMQRITANLSSFAHTGNLSDVSGIGLDANDPIVTAIVSARNKKKGGLSDDQIGDLIGQVFGGGYTGVLDSSNSSLVKSLTSFRDKTAKKGGVGGADLTSPRGIAAAFGDDMGKRFLANLLSGAGADAQFIGDLIGTPMYEPTGKSASTSQLIAEKNVLGAAGGLLGYEVPDHTRQGGAPGTQQTMATNTPAYNVAGQISSDVAGIVDRTLTSFKASLDAKFDQMTAILTQMRDQLASIAGKLVNSAISSGSQAAGQVAGAAVSVPGAGGAPGGFFDLSGTKGFGPFFETSTQIGGLFDEGGLWKSGTFGTNLSGADERVLNPNQTRLFDAGLLGGWNRQPLQQHMASVDGQDVTGSVGADFFGLGRVPIIGTILNFIISILLKTLGIHIEARNTLTDLTQQVRQFRGDFKSFNSAGLIAGDSSGLISRNESSKDTVNKERVRILTEVIVGVVKYLIEKVIVPLVNTLVQSVINIGQQAIGMAISAGVNSVAPGAGGIAGQAGSAIAGIAGSLANTLAQVASEFLGNLATNAVTELVPGILNMLPRALFSLFNIPGVITKLFGGVGAVLASVAGVFGGIFDEGGVANGIGMMPKATVRPERVLSPAQTASFERLVEILDASGLRGGGGNSIDAKIYVEGGPTAPAKIRDEIVALAGT